VAQLVKPKKAKRAKNHSTSARQNSRTSDPVITNLYSPSMDDEVVVSLLLDLLGVEDSHPADGLDLINDEGVIH
jgi:hypothetical protein